MSNTRAYGPSRGDAQQQADCRDPKPACVWQASLKVGRGGSRSGRMVPRGTCEGTAETGDVRGGRRRRPGRLPAEPPAVSALPGPPPRPHAAQEPSLRWSGSRSCSSTRGGVGGPERQFLQKSSTRENARNHSPAGRGRTTAGQLTTPATVHGGLTVAVSRPPLCAPQHVALRDRAPEGFSSGGSGPQLEPSPHNRLTARSPRPPGWVTGVCRVSCLLSICCLL